MKNINGQGNEITIILPHKKIDCISSHHEQFNQIIHQSHIIITGNNNHVSMHFDSEQNVEKLLLNEGFLLIIKGNDNTVNLGTIILRYSNILGMSGLKPSASCPVWELVFQELPIIVELIQVIVQLSMELLYIYKKINQMLAQEKTVN